MAFNKKCEGQLWKEGGGFAPCQEQAVTWRKNFRWGDTSKGEKAVVKIRVYFCQACAIAADDNQAEAAAEARCS